VNKPETTLFMLMSLDGKISTGDTDTLDIDQDYKNIQDLKNGLQQYYDLEMQTDLFSLNTGRVFAKIGFNKKTDEPKKIPVSFVVIDNKPHLKTSGLKYLAKKSSKLFIVTTNLLHPVFNLKKKYSNIEIILYEQNIDFKDLFAKLYNNYGVYKLTIQSGGTLNSVLVREGLVDRILVVVAPALIGGKNTSTLIDGESLHKKDDLMKVKTLKLIQAKLLYDSYILLEYKVRN
jgi:2,5-diamino-6-(ribosylamino)-4(3H)-pyrimidinone 5'-phosphate reductase